MKTPPRYSGEIFATVVSLVMLSQTRAAVPENYGLQKARESLGKMTVAEGLSVSLFAAEPMVQNPTNFDIDAKGRVWITEAANYRRYAAPPIRPEGDRIMVLEDTKGTGEADKATVFYQDPSVNSALGIAVLGGDVLVSVAPNVFVLRDTDGDGKADRRLLLLTGKAGEQHDHAFHSFVHGTDGKLYFNFGNVGGHIRRPTGTLLEIPLHGVILSKDVMSNSEPIVDLAGNVIEASRKPYQQGMAFRADYEDGRLTNFEVLGNNFRNNYELAPDSFSTVWQSDNDDDGNRGVRINYVMEHGNFGYSDEITGGAWQTKRPNIEKEIPLRHWHQNDPGVVPNLLQTGAGSPTGILVNEGQGLGAVFANQMIHCDAGPRVVRAYPVAKSGAGYTAKMVDVLTSTDPWFRPSDVAMHPDGSLFVADWYDAGVGGHAMADNEEPTLRGRIYRVAAKGVASVSQAPDFATVDGALRALKSPNKATQYMAYRALLGMGEAAVPSLTQMSATDEPRMQARAVAVLARSPGVVNAALARAIQSKDADLVVYGVRLATMLAVSGKLDTSALEAMPGLVGGLLRHKDPQVRRQVALSLYHSQGVAAMWAKLAAQHDGSDRWYLEALGIGSIGSEDECFDRWLDEVRGNWNTPGGRDIVWRLRSPKTARYLAELLLASPGEMRYMRAFDFLPNCGERTEALLTLAKADVSVEVVTEALQRLSKTSAKDGPEFGAVLEKAIARTKGQPAFVALLEAVGVGRHADELLRTAVQLGSTPEALDGMRLLLRDTAGSEKLRAMLKGAAGTQRDAVAGMLGSLGSPASLDILESLLLEGKDSEQRAAVVRALARTQAGAERLIALAKGGRFPEEHRATAASALALVQYAALQKEIGAHFPSPGASEVRSASAAELAALPGDAERGRLVFERPASSCVTCHRIGGVGADFGPVLGAVGVKLPKEAILEAIINPNAGISMGFETSEVHLRSGGQALGIVRSDTVDELVLVLPGGALQRFPKNEVKKVSKLPHSMMPSGLNQALSRAELVDLVEYLTKQRAVQ
jgi:putative membrane-bound dehydrogenase-like protein